MENDDIIALVPNEVGEPILLVGRDEIIRFIEQTADDLQVMVKAKFDDAAKRLLDDL